ncbi:MAG: 3-dehydro-L-gulonate 2-dehydrogenase [Chitinophagaceae bacterium]|nr:3-dehydro-L-gulonate 2-dehydrogenase [Chitinophagaceae bacterium]
MPDIVRIPAKEMKEMFHTILLNHGLEQSRALLCAEIFTNNSVDGVYTHGVNRFPRFISNIDTGHVNATATPSLKYKFGAIEQWDGNLGPGPSNAVRATESAMQLSTEHGIGCVALSRTNHWMRGGTYGWQAAKKGFVFIGWTNTIGNMPAWGATDNRLGNNPLVIAIPFEDEAIVLDMAMSQYSFGAMELAQMKNENFPVYGGYDLKGELTKDPAAILESRRPLPIGFWKGAGLSLLLDILATILSGGWSTSEITKREVEYGLSQVFVVIDLSRLGNHSLIPTLLHQIIEDYHQSIPQDEKKNISYPGERVMKTRKQNLTDGIPVLKKIWEKIEQL